MTGTICVQTSHSLSRSYLNHLVFTRFIRISFILYSHLFFVSNNTAESEIKLYKDERHYVTSHYFPLKPKQ